MGAFRDRSPRSRAQIVRRVCEGLQAQYGVPRLGNPRRPLDDLFFILVSNRTASPAATRVFRSLRGHFPRWGMLAGMRASVLERILKPAGLSAKKAKQMRGIARRLLSEFGSCSLAPLKNLSDREVLEYLCSLPGVSTKVAQCVMMYTMGRSVLPVDVHVHRISTRLGWVERKRADQSHDILARLVPMRRRQAFHVDCIVHGRTVCTSSRPRCSACAIARYCEWPMRNGNEDTTF
jgi:endonuclease III